MYVEFNLGCLWLVEYVLSAVRGVCSCGLKVECDLGQRVVAFTQRTHRVNLLVGFFLSVSFLFAIESW